MQHRTDRSAQDVDLRFFSLLPQGGGRHPGPTNVLLPITWFFFASNEANAAKGEGRREAGGYRPLDRFRAEEGDQFLADEGFVVFCPILARAMEFQEGRGRNKIAPPPSFLALIWLK